ncbi:mannose-6-phosphate isomerase, class I [Sneathia sanguinegens]|uniref:mannose-6-phosphate isomerase, class I n=1 Tax=Sneathia sanguinegens TaxID=40543 RepID=UPI0023F9C5D8|nr:mannose-6-phosphate isomerase, class I [Sneathia sanguinegens]
MELIFLKPYMKEVVWGGTRIQKEYGYMSNSDHIGEAWLVSANENGLSKVINGKYKGLSLKELWDKHREIFGEELKGVFPLLIKYIDAKDNLSIQVHPNDDYARVVEQQPNGKAESWYILDCDKDSDILIGHNAKNKEEFKKYIDNKEWDKLLRIKKIKKGDFFNIPAGTVHAIRKGTLILETQQNSDITYRLYDYDRLQQNGKKRELHIKKSIDVVTCPYDKSKVEIKPIVKGDKIEYINNEKFSITKYIVKNELNIEFEKFYIICVIEGKGSINDIEIAKGTNFIVPKSFGRIKIKGEMELMLIHN